MLVLPKRGKMKVTKTTNEGGFLVALHGLPRVGKDTVVNALVKKHFFQKIAFADALYAEVADSFGVSATELASDTWKRYPQNLISIQCSDCPKFRALMGVLGHDPSTPRTSRFILRNWAHEYRRSDNSDYWISEFQQKAVFARKSIAVPDLRYAVDEYHFLKSFSLLTRRRLVVFEIVNPSVTLSEHHASDDRLPAEYINHTVINIQGDPAQMIGDVFQHLGLR